MADAAPTDREIFDELVELPLAERDRALERLAVEPARRVRIARLLLAEGKVSRTTGFLDRAFVAAIADAGSVPIQPEHLPKRLGHFTLLREIGSGGMGIVYEAEQDYPKRRVALKVMRSDLGTRELTQRFRREIETLGRLQHPGIAQIHEAGTISEGEWARAPIPYIAMQLVTGTALDDWCARERPGPRRIAELIASTCDAIQHAHQRGVVHRDLKPANILVVRDPDSSGSSPPRTIVLDFGIARLIEADGPRGVHPTLATSAGQILGTIAYMSPEQLGGDPSAIDIRTDVYALGVILYELLSGRSPLDVRDRPLADAARIVRDEEPTRLGAINPSLRGDLETIVAKAIEKEPARRYPAASALGEELRRHLRDEPILAKPTTRIERLRRFTRRHRAVVGGAVATFLALASGTVVTSIFAAKAVSQRDAAEWQAYRANIAAASAALNGHDVETARRYLDATAVRFRGWEWRYLHASLDRSLARVDLPDSPYLSSPQLQACPSVWPALAKHRGADEQGGDSPAPRLGAPRLGAPPDADGVAQLQVANADGTREVWTLPPTLTKAARVSMRIGGPTAELSTIELNEHPNANIQSIALSTDASALVAVLSLPSDAAHRPASLLWHCSLATGQRRTIEIGNSGRHFALAAGPGPLVGAGGGPNRLPCIWNAETGTVLDLLGHIGDINAITVSHDGRLVATGGADRTVRLFDATTGATIAIAREHIDEVTCVAFAPDDRTLLSGSLDRTVRLWSVPGLTDLLSLDGHAEALMAADFGHDATTILSMDRNGSLRLWPIDSGQSTGDIRVVDNSWGAIDLARNRPLLFGLNAQGNRRVLSVHPTVKAMAAHEARESSLVDAAISPSGDRVAHLTNSARAVLLEVTQGGFAERWRSLEAVDAVGFTAAGQLLVALPGDARVLERLRAAPDLAPVALPLPTCVSPSMHSNRDGSLLALRDHRSQSGEDVVVLDGSSGRELVRTVAAYGWTFSLRTLPDGRDVIATVEPENGVMDGCRLITVRNARTGEVERRLQGHTAHVFSVAFSPDGSRLASAGRDRLVRIWDTATWDLIASLPGPTSYVWAVRFSADGEVLATSGGDRVYRIWRGPAR